MRPVLSPAVRLGVSAPPLPGPLWAQQTACRPGGHQFSTAPPPPPPGLPLDFVPKTGARPSWAGSAGRPLAGGWPQGVRSSTSHILALVSISRGGPRCGGCWGGAGATPEVGAHPVTHMGTAKSVVPHEAHAPASGVTCELGREDHLGGSWRQTLCAPSASLLVPRSQLSSPRGSLIMWFLCKFCLPFIPSSYDPFGCV